ncbi:CARDB domain-containing protein [Pyxidicoccus sp. 3LG]
MHARRWWALALTGTLVGCVVEPPSGPEWDPPSTEWPEEPVFGKADFRIDTLTGPTELGEGDRKLQARVCNMGSDFGSTEVSFYLSEDRVLDGRDRLLATSSQVSLLEGNCGDASVWVSAPAMPEGNYQLIAEVDPNGRVQEGSESNNLRTGPSVLIDRTAPTTPFLSWASRGTANGHNLTIETEPGAQVLVYEGPNCTGYAVEESQVDSGAYCEVPISVPAPTSSGTYSVRVYDSAGNYSSCSPAVEYPYGGGSGGTAPVLLATRPGSPGRSLTPIFDGRATPRTAVEIFENASCEGEAKTVVTSDNAGASRTRRAWRRTRR